MLDSKNIRNVLLFGIYRYLLITFVKYIKLLIICLEDIVFVNHIKFHVFEFSVGVPVLLTLPNGGKYNDSDGVIKREDKICSWI